MNADDEALQKRAREIQGKYGNLLTRDAALALAREELLRSAGSAGISITARIGRIFRPYAFEKAGRKGKVCRVEVREAGGESHVLVLWDADVDRLGRELREGDEIYVNGAYEKEGELHIGRHGSVIPAKDAGMRAAISAQTISAKSQPIMRDLRAEGSVLHATVEKDGKLVKIVAKDEKAARLLGLKSMHEGISLATLVELKKESLLGSAVPAA